MTTTTRSVPLDFAFDENGLEHDLDEIQSAFYVRVDVVNQHGPGAGWPVVVVSGARENVLTALQEAWGLVSDAEDYLDDTSNRVRLANLTSLVGLEDLLRRLLDAREAGDNDEVFELLEQLDDLFD